MKTNAVNRIMAILRRCDLVSMNMGRLTRLEASSICDVTFDIDCYGDNEHDFEATEQAFIDAVGAYGVTIDRPGDGFNTWHDRYLAYVATPADLLVFLNSGQINYAVELSPHNTAQSRCLLVHCLTPHKPYGDFNYSYGGPLLEILSSHNIKYGTYGQAQPCNSDHVSMVIEVDGMSNQQKHQSLPYHQEQYQQRKAVAATANERTIASEALHSLRMQFRAEDVPHCKLTEGTALQAYSDTFAEAVINADAIEHWAIDVTMVLVGRKERRIHFHTPKAQRYLMALKELLDEYGYHCAMLTKPIEGESERREDTLLLVLPENGGFEIGDMHYNLHDALRAAGLRLAIAQGKAIN